MVLLLKEIEVVEGILFLSIPPSTIQRSTFSPAFLPLHVGEKLFFPLREFFYETLIPVTV